MKIGTAFAADGQVTGRKPGHFGLSSPVVSMSILAELSPSGSSQHRMTADETLRMRTTGHQLPFRNRRDQSLERQLHSQSGRAAYGSDSVSATDGLMAQSGSNVLVTCRSSVRRRRTAASPFCQLELSTLSGHTDSSKAASLESTPSLRLAATKPPFVTSRLRPETAPRQCLRSTSRTTASSPTAAGVSTSSFASANDGPERHNSSKAQEAKRP